MGCIVRNYEVHLCGIRVNKIIYKVKFNGYCINSYISVSSYLDRELGFGWCACLLQIGESYFSCPDASFD